MMTSPETEASIILLRHISRFHDDVMDKMRLMINRLEGTFDGAILNDIMRSFLHHDVARAIRSAADLHSKDLCIEIQILLRNYLDTLPQEKAQIASTVYSVCSLNDIHALLMSCVPNPIIGNLKLLNGGRFLIEQLEMLLVVVAKSMA
jgi:hypothetical protein